MQRLQQFGPFQFDAETLTLLRDGSPLALGRRGALILAAMLAEPGRVVGKDRLMEAAWPGQVVEDSNLSVQIARLRRLIGPHWIRTIERVGYQFAHPVTTDAAPHREAMTSADPFPVIGVSALDIDDDHVGTDGRTVRAELMAALARFRTLRVVEEPLDSLLVDYRVRLSLNTGPDARARAVCRLSHGATGRVVWAQGFDIVNALGTASAMAASIHSAVEMTEIRGGPRGTGTARDAYGHYLAGRRALNTSLAADNATALSHFMEAVRLAPTNVTYLSAATEAMHHRLSVGWSPIVTDDKTVARQLAYRALELADDDAVAISLIGNALITVDEEDFGIALSRRALAMNPNSELVLACALHAEHWGGSMDQMDRISQSAVSLAPDDPGQRFAIGGQASVAYLAGDYESALARAYRSLTFGAGYSAAHWTAVASLVELGRQDEAERHLLRYMAMAPGVTVHSVENGQHFADRRRLARKIDALRRAGLPER
ncbi:MAG TPA: winged helix-turn-helix domain-containing protein [Devosia sp.]|nr:winged helix-turn-helix domain-containing protein [Devosia sp.]